MLFRFFGIPHHIIRDGRKFLLFPEIVISNN